MHKSCPLRPRMRLSEGSNTLAVCGRSFVVKRARWHAFAIGLPDCERSGAVHIVEAPRGTNPASLNGNPTTVTSRERLKSKSNKGCRVLRNIQLNRQAHSTHTPEIVRYRFPCILLQGRQRRTLAVLRAPEGRLRPANKTLWHRTANSQITFTITTPASRRKGDLAPGHPLARGDVNF